MADNPEKSIPTNTIKKKELNKRQKAFVKFYIETGNASISAEKAGYSKACAGIIGHKMLKNTNIAAEISKRQQVNEQKLLEEHGIKMQELRARLVAIGFSALKNYAKWDEHGLELIDSEKTDSLGLKSIKIKRTCRTDRATGETVEEMTTSITLDDRIKALIALGEHVGMFNEKGKDNDGNAGTTEMLQNRVSELFEKFRASKAG